MSQFTNPRHQFDGYDEHEDAEYRQMMPFIMNVENIQAKALGDWLMDNLAPTSVVDFGCGPGLYLVPFEERGAAVMGFDACSEAGQCLGSDEFVRYDLRFPLTFDRMFDFAICFEILEHMHESYEDVLIRTISEASDTVVFSWAVPGQGGSYHVNERSHEYALAKFAQYGYRLHPLQGAMREFLEQFRPHEARGEVSGWLINNSFLVTKV